MKLTIRLFLILGAVVMAGCKGKKDKALKEMSFDELTTKVEEAVVVGHDDATIKALEQLVAQFPEKETIPTHKILLGDLYLKNGRYEAAHKMYEHYSKLYPSDPQAEYAQFNALKAKFYKTLKVAYDCDSQDAEKTIALCEDYLKQEDKKQYRNDVKDILHTCQTRLVDKEVYVFNNYIRHGQYKSAQNRLDDIKNQWASKDIPDLAPRVMYLECKLANEQSNVAVVEQTFEKMLEKYPDSQFTRMAAGMIRTSGFIF
jgi:outer membrane assembly lipoprotein YfiO